MFDRTLTERLEASTARQPHRASEFNRSIRFDSVLQNVRRIFNERRGSCETRPDYGMPDLNDVLGGGGTPASLALIIQSVLETFEPRLASPVVRYSPDPDDPTRVVYRIAAVLIVGDGSERVAFETVVTDGARLRVRG